MVDTSPLEWRKGYGYVWKHFYDRERTKILADYKRYTQLYYRYVDVQDCLRHKLIKDNYN